MVCPPKKSRTNHFGSGTQKWRSLKKRKGVWALNLSAGIPDKDSMPPDKITGMRCDVSDCSLTISPGHEFQSVVPHSRFVTQYDM